MAETNEEKGGFQKVFSDISNLLLGGVAIVAVASVVYEYFYFVLIGPQFLQLYSATDFIKLAVKWMPAFGLAASIGLWINAADMKERQKAYKRFGQEGLRQWEKADKSMDYATKFVVLSAAVSLPFMSWSRILILQIPVYICD